MYSEILVPTDGGPASDAAIEHAIDLANQYGARLHALYVVDGAAYSSLEAGAEIVVEALESEGEEATGRVADAAADAGVECVTSVTSGTAYRSIHDYVDEHGIDVVVMGTHGRKGLDRYLLGSVTERVVRTSDVPVLTVRQPTDE
ncbi:UspA domain protein [Halorubrum distributum JCM 9100]|uniref:UspA domain protein n=4 Tax=Halorubrum distributum TaxID=29283 RepID=M0EJQ7_9EURY|nr:MULTISPECIES: universal stress protein [Halorubrum distributum group]ELZ46654.1 UspA domain protein [Halorubrum distributum JCM 9100]ELZ54907.1 UspA domain protein [Halorubrum distributum JCM 10118]EMA72546.1 UspA domain protein [Halorubrum arcis JCM 13916]MYL17709.1 universal stress protein [Halorubrum terrestre]MYL68895.1 universal stress protein [Halorubrum terrestre]